MLTLQNDGVKPTHQIDDLGTGVGLGSPGITFHPDGFKTYNVPALLTTVGGWVDRIEETETVLRLEQWFIRLYHSCQLTDAYFCLDSSQGAVSEVKTKETFSAEHELTHPNQSKHSQAYAHTHKWTDIHRLRGSTTIPIDEFHRRKDDSHVHECSRWVVV